MEVRARVQIPYTSQMSKRALVLQGGTMRGAFLVGALKTIHRLLGVNYFDAIFATSVGVFEQAFFASNQIYIMENTWSKYVHGNQLINFLNPLKRKPVLDLDYLVDLFQSDKSMLDIKAMRESHPNLYVFVADYKTKNLSVLDLKKNDIFQAMKATCALPFLYPKKVILNDKRCGDCWMAPKQKLQELLQSNLTDYDQILAITTNKDSWLKGISHIIRPTKNILRYPFDTDRYRIIQTIKQGETDTEKFIIDHNLVNVKI